MRVSGVPGGHLTTKRHSHNEECTRIYNLAEKKANDKESKIGREGLVEVAVQNDLSKPVKIYGTAVFSGKRNIVI